MSSWLVCEPVTHDGAITMPSSRALLTVAFCLAVAAACAGEDVLMPCPADFRATVVSISGLVTGRAIGSTRLLARRVTLPIFTADATTGIDVVP